MIIWKTEKLGVRPLQMLWYHARGAFPGFASDKPEEPVVWVKPCHHGIQRLDRIQIPSGQKRYVFSKRFDVRVNGDFEQVLRQCAAPREKTESWITPELMAGYIRLHRLGFAHSFEAWEKGELVAGFFGVQIGGFVSCASMFHLVDHAGKAAYVRTLLNLRERGFTHMDIGAVSPHFERWGAEWVHQWEFEALLRQLMPMRVSIADTIPCPRLPWHLNTMLEAVRLSAGAARRLGLRRSSKQRATEAVAAESVNRETVSSDVK